jgi:hypothetical protein
MALIGTISSEGLHFRNRIINGGMVIDQRNAGASVTATADIFCVDRWAIGFGSPVNAFTAQQSATAPVGFTNSLVITAGTGASASTTGYAVLRQAIEGYNISDLNFGSANAKTITISFWVRSSLTGTFGLSIRNEAGNRAYGATYTISSANTFEYKTVTIPGDTSGTWATTNGFGIHLFFDLGAGSNYDIPAGSWQSGSNMFGVEGTVKLTETTGATFYITGVQLEVGSVATPFERRPFGMELALCQRYYWRLTPNTVGNAGDGGFGSSANWSSAAAYSGIIFPVTMRAGPTGSTAALANFTYLTNGVGHTPTGIDLGSAGPQRVEMIVQASGGTWTQGQAGWLRIGSSGFLQFSAEL